MGRDIGSLIRAIEGFASPTGLLPEQIWDQADRPDLHIYLGKPTGAAMPLMWAHAEYIKLLRSVRDGMVFDQIPAVAERYLPVNRRCRALEIWKPNRQPKAVWRGHALRIQAPAAFRLHWTRDEWQSVADTASSPTALGIEFVDIPVSSSQRAPIRFTFYWTQMNRWEGRDYEVAVARE